MEQNNDVNIINHTHCGSVATFTDIGVKGRTCHAKASWSALHINTKGWLRTSTNGLSNKSLKHLTINEFGQCIFEPITPVLGGLYCPSLGCKHRVGIGVQSC